MTVPFNASYAPGPEEVRLRRQPDLDHAKRERSGRLLEPVLHGAAGRRRAQGLARRRRHLAGRAQGRPARRPDRHDEPGRRDETIKPSKQPKVFNDSNDTVAALKQSQVDAIVVDLPTALYLTAAEIPERRRRRPVRRARRRHLGRPAGQGLRADRVREQGDRAAQGLRRARADSTEGGWAAQPARPSCSERDAPPAARERPGRRARRPRRHRRGAADLGALDASLVLGGLTLLIVTSQGWHNVRETFFSWADFKALVPGRAERLLARREAVRHRRDARAGARARRRAGAHHAGAGAVPAAPVATVYTDVLRGVPTILLVYLIGFGVPALSSPGCRPTRSSWAGSR